MSELGYHTAARCRGWWLWRRCRRWTDADVWRHLHTESAFFARHGAEFLTVYQVTDGPTEIAINRYGRTRNDGTWKEPSFP